MSNEPIPAEVANTADLAVTEYDAGHRDRAAERSLPEADAVPSVNNEPLKVGLPQKGDGEKAVVKSESEI